MQLKQKLSVIFLCVLALFVLGCHNAHVISFSTPSKPVERNEINNKILPKDSVMQENRRKEYGYQKGDTFLNKYRSSVVNQIILVAQSDAKVSDARLFLMTKDSNGDWVEKFNCPAFLGKNGIDKKIEGDLRTPTGD